MGFTMTERKAAPSSTRNARLPGLSLRAKGVSALVIPMAALFAALFSIYWSEEQSSEADEVVRRAYETRAELLRLRVSQLDSEMAVNRYLAQGDARSLAAFDAARGAATRSLSHLESLSRDDAGSWEAFLRLREAIDEEVGILGGLRGRAGPPAGGGAAVERARELGAEVEKRLDLVNQAQDLRLLRARNERDEARRRQFRVILVCGIIGPLGALLVHLLVFGRFVRRLKVVGENARRLAHGLPLEPYAASDDEIHDVAAQLEESANLLRARERQIRDSEQRYRDLFDQAPIPYEETDREGTVKRFNQAVCTLLKRSPERMRGRRAWELASPERQEELRAAFVERVQKGVASGPFECDYLLDDGSRITVEIRENPIQGEGGEVTGVCRSLLDVTERNLAVVASRKVSQYAMELRNKNEQLGRALAAARSATEAKSRFLASVSHELRTPLNGIIGFSEVIHDGKAGPLSEMQQEFLGDILTSARHLLQLINDVLDLSKVEAGKMEFTPENCRIASLVREVCDVVRPLAEKKQLAMVAEVPPGFTAFLDGARFKQVVYNYLSNAVKFTPPGGSVIVRVGPAENESFRLEVEDSGMGISSSELPLLFQEFQQLPGSRKAGQGTGLGLALTRHIVEVQGGTVAVRSTPGRGSIFSAVLPISTSGHGTKGSKADHLS